MHVSKSRHFIHVNKHLNLNVKLFLLLHTVKTTRDVHITESAIGAVAGPGAQVGTASVVVSQSHPPSKDEGVSNNAFMCSLS